MIVITGENRRYTNRISNTVSDTGKEIPRGVMTSYSMGVVKGPKWCGGSIRVVCNLGWSPSASDVSDRELGWPSIAKKYLTTAYTHACTQTKFVFCVPVHVRWVQQVLSWIFHSTCDRA